MYCCNIYDYYCKSAWQSEGTWDLPFTVLRDKYVLERDDGSKVYVAFVDEDHTKNIWQVTHQTTVVGKYTNRYDVTILCNGLPIVQIELKRRGMDLRQAINQIMRYKKHSYIGLYRYIQCFVVSNGVDTKYFANSDKDILYSLTFFWTDENNIRITNLKEFSVAFLAKDALTRLLLRYTVLNDVEKAVMIIAYGHFPRPSGPRSPARQGHIKRPVLRLAEPSFLRPANQCC